VDVPAVTPVTTPVVEPTVAFPLLLVQVPPDGVQFSEVVELAQTVKVPVIVPGLVETVTVILFVQVLGSV